MDNNHLHPVNIDPSSSSVTRTDQQTVQSVCESFTYVDDEEVEPAPVVGEVLLESVREPLEQHLQDEDVGEDLVGVLQHHLDHPPLLDVDVLEGLKGAAERDVTELFT